MDTNDVRLSFEDSSRGCFLITNGEDKIAEMQISAGPYITVYHTEVQPESQGQGLAKKLLDALVNYARIHHIQIYPYCPYVSGQFNRDPEAYSDVWKKEKPGSEL